MDENTIVLADTAFLIILAKAGVLDLIKSLYKKIYITTEVKKEIEFPLTQGYDAPEVIIIQKADWIKEIVLTKKEREQAKILTKIHKGIDKGEAELVVLSKRYKNNIIIFVEDHKAKRKLKELKVNALDILDVCYLMAKRGIINLKKLLEKIYYKAHYTSRTIKKLLSK